MDYRMTIENLNSIETFKSSLIVFLLCVRFINKLTFIIHFVFIREVQMIFF